jgi:hypothetical protein
VIGGQITLIKQQVSILHTAKVQASHCSQNIFQWFLVSIFPGEQIILRFIMFSMVVSTVIAYNAKVPVSVISKGLNAIASNIIVGLYGLFDLFA